MGSLKLQFAAICSSWLVDEWEPILRQIQIWNLKSLECPLYSMVIKQDLQYGHQQDSLMKKMKMAEE